MIRKLILLGCLVGLAGSAQAAPVFIQANGNGVASTTSFTATFTNATTTGNGIIVVCVLNNRASGTVTISDNSSTSFAKDVDFVTTRNDHMFVYSGPNIVGRGAGTHTVTCAPSTASEATMVIAEYSGLATSAPFDVSATSTTAAANTWSAGPTATTSQASELVIGIGYEPLNATTHTAGSGYTNERTQTNPNGDTIGYEDKVVSSTGTQTAGGTFGASAADLGGVVATYKAPVVSGGGSSKKKRVVFY